MSVGQSPRRLAIRQNKWSKKRKERESWEAKPQIWLGSHETKKAIEDGQTNVFNLFMTSALGTEKALKGQEIAGTRNLLPFISTRALYIWA